MKLFYLHCRTITIIVQPVNVLNHVKAFNVLWVHSVKSPQIPCVNRDHRCVLRGRCANHLWPIRIPVTLAHLLRTTLPVRLCTVRVVSLTNERFQIMCRKEYILYLCPLYHIHVERREYGREIKSFFDAESDYKSSRAMSNKIICPQNYKCTKLSRDSQSVCCPKDASPGQLPAEGRQQTS